jgi:hypothetical protein
MGVSATFDRLGPARLATEPDVARVIFVAATDGKVQLRAVATEDIGPPVTARRETWERKSRALMRSQSFPKP